ncbi:MAG: 4-(cytidine 5'-diphospho)-2-C-methyl-D-erythritol kinase [Actinomycetota bacterium]|nr:4-(cytidine 5'-diphospho)-2-C-methyl-D-erythritol kinase [Actinomycetota bacterium]
MSSPRPHGGPASGGWTRLEAPAKLTLSLRVTGVRDDGYHLLEAEMVTVDLVDTLEIGPGDGLSVVGPADGLGVVGPAGRLSAAGATGAPVPADGTNLVNRALRALGRQARVRLTKRIPAGAGLGGGSADAAAVLRWGGCQDLMVAAGLGGDVPFCLVGGRALVSGIGEQLVPIPLAELEDQAFTLLTPPLGVSTAEVYRAWDRLGGPRGERDNDLEPAALEVEPRLAVWRDRLGELTGEEPRLAGSGSTWWVPGEHHGEGLVVVRSCPAPPSRPAV